MSPIIRYRKANIGKRYFPLAGMNYPLSPWNLNTDPYKKEQVWLNKAWLMLVEEGMVTFDAEPERTQVAVRAMALALMYLDYCGMIFEVSTDEPPVEAWAESLGLTRETLLARYNRLCGKNYTFQDIEDENEEHLWTIIANEARGEVFDVLLKGFGNINDFFDSMLEIARHNHDHALDAFVWFEEKMPPRYIENYSDDFE